MLTFVLELERLWNASRFYIFHLLHPTLYEQRCYDSQCYENMVCKLSLYGVAEHC